MLDVLQFVPTKWLVVSVIAVAALIVLAVLLIDPAMADACHRKCHCARC